MVRAMWGAGPKLWPGCSWGRTGPAGTGDLRWWSNFGAFYCFYFDKRNEFKSKAG